MTAESGNTGNMGDAAAALRTGPEGEVFDLGYRHYTGQRGGRGTAFIAVYADGLRAVAGLGRGAGAKILPIVFALLALGPALFIVSLAGAVTSFGGDPNDIDLPSHADYYGFAFLVILLFAAAVGPALLSPDRRNSVTALYAVRPLKFLDYATARALAFLTVTAVFLLTPQLLLFVSFALSDDSPGGYIRDNWQDLPYIAVTGLGLAAFMTALAMAASSLTARRAFATAGVIGFVFLTSAVGGFGEHLLADDSQLVVVRRGGELIREAPHGDISHYAGLLIIPRTSQRLMQWVFGSRDNLPISIWYSVAMASLITAGGFGVMAWRYRRVGT